jgi:pimeloyl-ACP methyl ester carboxylesterase
VLRLKLPTDRPVGHNNKMPTQPQRRPLLVTVSTPFGDAEVAVETAGTGPSVVLVHPNPGCLHDYDAIWDHLATRFHVTRFDWPGYGNSPAAAHVASAVGYSEVLASLIGVLGLDRPVIVGNSVGGFAAASFAINHPTTAGPLVLVSPGGFTRTNALTRMACRAIGSRTLGPLAMRTLPRSYLRERNATTTAIRARAKSGSRNASTVATFRSLWRSFAGPEHDLRKQTASLSVPVLLVWGKHDTVLRWRADGRRAARLLDVKPIVLPCGHQPYAELPDAFLSAILPFIEANTKPKGAA